MGSTPISFRPRKFFQLKDRDFLYVTQTPFQVTLQPYLTLKLFRRHEAKCEQGYPKDERVYEHDSVRLTGKAQCSCPVYAEGKLPGGSYQRPKSTGSRTFEQARLLVQHWGTAPEAPTASATSGYRLRTVVEAVEDFTGTCRARGVTSERMLQFEHLLELRLIPFAAAKRIDYIQEMDNAEIWGQFRRSWKNENPNRNRPVAEPDQVAVRPLGKGTVCRMIGDLRMFVKHCISREWLSENWTTREHGMVGDSRVDPKEPFTEEDLVYIYRASEHMTDGRGFGAKRTGTRNGFEDLVFVWVLRYSGLRIGDAVALTADNLVEFAEGRYTHSIWCNPRKTNCKDANFVNVPIPNGNFPGHPNVVAALETMPLKHGHYFFLGGGPVPPPGTPEFRDRIKSATTTWRKRLDRLFRVADSLLADDGKAFTVKPHPHRFRHTFCARLLQLHVPLRVVAQYVGDTEDTVRKHYAKFCVAEQRAAARLVDEAMSRGPERAGSISSRPPAPSPPTALCNPDKDCQ